MRIAVGLDTDGPIEATIGRASRLAERGFTNFWSSQIFGPDTLTVLALVGHELRELNLGTAVVPIQTRHATMLAAQARTVQDAIGARLSLGVGLSHQTVVEGMWGLSFERPASYMREYLDALVPMLRGEAVNIQGERVKVVTIGALGPKDVVTPSLLVAALGSRMLQIAGTLADGTLLWMTGRQTIASHVTPTIREAASAANRGEPRIVCSLPIAVTNDVQGAKERINNEYALYATLPSYAAMLEKEGESEPAGVSLIGSKEHVLDELNELANAGVTEFSGAPSGTKEEREAALETLIDYQRGS
ncbi:MAG TPA: TIGR03564 family F420-dependent LLM class oxidoreductase [Acidimicrobiales bacterium]|jgi:F420-dependent oxidoreductase-like protein|nr:TIGR03564 family F420-dependent LLM class oxidoreductase [Acidimicrobiales bacterium]